MSRKHASRPKVRPPRENTGDSALTAGRSGSKHLAEIITICWMLATGMAMVCEAISLALRALSALKNNTSTKFIALAQFFSFDAIVVGAIALVLMAVALRLRDDRPPTSIKLGTLAVGLAPWVDILVRTLR
ncbi:MAG TPA: hypothetical protein VG713_13985 [Pirellulales bacterium]|nr:hypothetical protein [Pirellulales bacterium]